MWMQKPLQILAERRSDLTTKTNAKWRKQKRVQTRAQTGTDDCMASIQKLSQQKNKINNDLLISADSSFRLISTVNRKWLND